MTKQPVLFDHRGRKVAFSFGDYRGGRNDRLRHPHAIDLNPASGTRHERDMLPHWDRRQIIGYLRRALRNNPIVAAIAQQYALGISSPTPHWDRGDDGERDNRETVLWRRMNSLVFGRQIPMPALLHIIAIEELIAGEVFLVQIEDQFQLVPGEFCGSPSAQGDLIDGERDGIVYDGAGRVIAYRFGMRDKHGTIHFDLAKGGQIIPAERVRHIGQASRIEEDRPAPRLAPCIVAIQDLDDIIEAKVTQVKNQAAFVSYWTKHIDPAMFAELMSTSPNPDHLFGMMTARSNYQEVRNGTMLYGEVGEDLRLLEPKINAQDFDSFHLSRLEAICAPLSIPPEEVVTGYRRSNYSSARADRNRWRQAVDARRHHLNWHLDAVAAVQLDAAFMVGEIETDSPAIDGLHWEWPPIREIDETKHAQAQAAFLSSGLKSRAMLAAENGCWADEVDRQTVQAASRVARMVRSEAARTGLDPREIAAYLPQARSLAESLHDMSLADAAESNAETNRERVKQEGERTDKQRDP